MLRHPVSRLLAAVLLVGSLLVIPLTMQPAPLAMADDCWQAMPWAPLGDAVVGTGANGAFAVSALGAKPVLAAAGGAAPAAASGFGLGTAGLALGTFLAASAGTCKFVDWFTSDGDQMVQPAPYVGLASDSAPSGWQLNGSECPGGGSTGCGGTWSGSAAIRHTPSVSLPAFTANTRCQSNATAGFTVGGNLFSVPSASALYPVVTPDPQLRLSNTTGHSCGAASSSVHTGNAGTGGLLPGNSFVIVPIVTAGANCGAASSVATIPTSGGLAGLGGNCGLHPNTAFVIHESGLVRSFLTVNPTAFAKGWARQIVTDSSCKSLTSTSETWVRATSATYFDREVSARIEVPTCPAGTVPRVTRSQRIPLNQTCTIGTVCTNGITIYEHTLPSTLTTVGTVPDWMTCLTAGATCGEPVEVSGTCTWGGFTMTSEACNPTKIAGTATIPQTVPKATGVLEPVPYVEGVPANTATTATTPPVDPPPTGTVTVPIEEGNGSRPGGFEPGEDEAECWPDGWGWFNPADWILKPVKCALMWAFVPDSDALLASWEDTYEAMEGAVPFAWVINAHGMVSDATFGMADAISDTESECFVWMADGSGGSSVPESDRGICPGELASGTGALSTWATIRDLLGKAIWIFWILALGRVVLGPPTPPETITEENGQMAWNF